MAPARGDLTDPDKVAEVEEEFKWICDWLAKGKVPVTKVTHTNVAGGTESYVIHFARNITDWRDFREKNSITFTAYGGAHNRIFGSEKARAMAYTAFVASRIENPENIRFGCGMLKWNQFHGNDAGEFWVFKDMKDFMGKGDIDVQCETFADREMFCWNCIVVEEFSDVIHCKCLGHAAGAENDGRSRITYADTSTGLVREHAESI